MSVKSFTVSHALCSKGKAGVRTPFPAVGTTDDADMQLLGVWGMHKDFIYYEES